MLNKKNNFSYDVTKQPNYYDRKKSSRIKRGNKKGDKLKKEKEMDRRKLTDMKKGKLSLLGEMMKLFHCEIKK